MKKNAFTLIELLVVIVIIGILATIGVAQYNNYQEKARLAKAHAFYRQSHMHLLAALTVNSQQPTIHWPFHDGTGNNFVDISGSGNDFSCSAGITAWTWEEDSPKGGTQSSIDISNGHLCTDGMLTEIKNPPETTGEYTMSTWFKPDEVSAGGGSFFNFDTRHYFYHNDDNTISYFHRGTEIRSEVVDVNRWHFVLATRIGNEVSFYLDGNKVGSQVVATNNLFTSLPYYSYNNGGLGQGLYRGLISESILYPIGYEPN
jgi:prepilin-type N-terminal cleavage/methylation domain-containing protein